MEEIITHIKQSNGGEVLIFVMSDNISFLKQEIENFDIYENEFELLKTDKRKIEFLNARLALNRLCERSIKINYDTEGKPFCKDRSIFISISHSKELMAVAIHPTKETGIDIEIISDRILKVRNKFLTENEQNAIGGDNKVLNFLIAWSAKEALYKIIGKNAVDFKEQLRIFPFENANRGTIKVLHTPANKFYYPEFKIFDKFVVVYAND